jgi:hypothetical protein
MSRGACERERKIFLGKIEIAKSRKLKRTISKSGKWFLKSRNLTAKNWSSRREQLDPRELGLSNTAMANA